MTTSLEDTLTDWALEYHRAHNRYPSPDEIREARERLRRPYQALQDSAVTFRTRIRHDAEQAGKSR